MADKKIIAVVGATGAQGSGMVRAILDHPSGGFAARALTRDVNSEKSKALAKLGAEVVAANVDDPASIQKAFEGAHGAFCVTFFWEHFSAEKEIAEIKSDGRGGQRQELAARRLVHARRHAQMGASFRQSHAHTQGEIQSSALRWQGRV